MLRMFVSLCALIVNATESIESGVETVCCAVDRPFYGMQYELVREDMCDSRSNRLVGYGRRERVDGEYCAPVTMHVERADDYGYGGDYGAVNETESESDVDIGDFELVPSPPWAVYRD